jgi:structural maintenance of chromosome 4
LVQESELAVLKGEKERFHHKLQATKRKTDVRETIRTLRRCFSCLYQELREAINTSRATLASRQAKVEEAKSSQNSAQSQNSVLDALTRLKNSGRITGFHVNFSWVEIIEMLIPFSGSSGEFGHDT